MIEAHLHLGKDMIFDGVDTTEEMILDVMEKNNLSGCVIYPASSNGAIECERAKHAEVRAFFDKYPNKIYGICQVNPNYGRDIYFGEVKRYVEEGFKGVAVNPQIYGWDPASSKGEMVFETAREMKVPLFVSVGIGLPLGMPIRLLPLCKKYKDLKIVLVHAGKSVYGTQCDLIAKNCPNVYLETSLSLNLRGMKAYCKKYGADRVIMGSAYVCEVPHSIYQYLHSEISEEELYWCTEGTIRSVLGIGRSERK